MKKDKYIGQKIVFNTFMNSNSLYIFQRCQEIWNPYLYKELKDVNTQVCEQKFAWSNLFSNVKSMNECRFNFYFHYILDMRNKVFRFKLWP